jgi:hypothetical protein
MKDCLTYFVLPLFTSFFGLWLGVTSSSDRLIKLTGNDIAQYENMKEICEEDIPRSQHCKAVISFEAGSDD